MSTREEEISKFVTTHDNWARNSEHDGDHLPATRATDISPRNKALILSSILRSGAPRWLSLSASSSSSMGGASSRRGVERPSAEMKQIKIC